MMKQMAMVFHCFTAMVQYCSKVILFHPPSKSSSYLSLVAVLPAAHQQRYRTPRAVSSFKECEKLTVCPLLETSPPQRLLIVAQAGSATRRLNFHCAPACFCSK